MSFDVINALQLIVSHSFSECSFVPWCAVLVRVLQTGQIPALGCQGTGRRTPLTASLVHVLQQLVLTQFSQCLGLLDVPGTYNKIINNLVIWVSSYICADACNLVLHDWSIRDLSATEA